MLNIKANLSVIVNGLAICHYFNGYWEFLLPREAGSGKGSHELKIIFRTYYKNKTPEIEKIEVDAEIKKIEIITDDKIEPVSGERFNFPGGAAAHDLDSRWILNISELYGKPVKLKNKNSKKFTYLKVPAGMLYNRRFPENPQVEIKRNNRSIDRLKVPQAAGIDIQWADGKGKTVVKDIDTGSQLIDDVVPNADVAFYEIEFDNNCSRPCAGELTDYEYYNQHLIDEDEKFSIYSLKSFSPDEKSLINGKSISEFLDDIGAFKCRDAPCFMGECPDILGINSLSELL